MKSKQTILFLLVAGMLLSACNKEDAPEPQKNNGQEDFTSMKVNGVYYEDATSGGGYISGSGNAAISGSFANGEDFYIYIDGAPDAGTYTLNAADDDCAFTDASGKQFSLSYGASNMTVEITDVEVNDVIKGIAGTFEGRLYSNDGDFVDITEGEFSDL